MSCLFSELRNKEVIDLRTGARLGYVCDAEYDPAEGRLLAALVRARLGACDAVRSVIALCLSLIGVSAPTQM